MKKVVGFVSLLLISAFVSAESTFIVSSKLYISDQLIGSPVMTTEAGKKTKLTVSESYSFEILTSKLDKNIVSVSTKINIDGEEYQPSISTKLNEKTSLEIGNLKWSLLVSKPEG